MNSQETNQSGRSMVEMLGVLAVTGLLSIIGVHGYTKAMTRYHANELLNEAAKRAVVVAGNLLNGDAGDLSQFDEKTVAGGKFKKDVSTPADGKFAIEIDGVNDDLCNLMKELASPIVQKIEPDTCSGDNNAMVLTYNNDLSTNSSGENPGGNPGGNITGGSSTEDGWTDNESGSDCTNINPPTIGEGQTACSVCLKTGTDTSDWFDSDAKCGANQVCVDGVCTGTSTGEGCLKNSDCKTLDPENCGNGECFCDYGQGNGQGPLYTDCYTGPKVKGTCEFAKREDIDYITLSATEDGISGIASENLLDWFSAKNFCEAHGKHMVSASELGINIPHFATAEDAVRGCKKDATVSGGNGPVCENVNWSKIKGKLTNGTAPITATGFWMKDLYPSDSCGAFIITSNGQMLHILPRNTVLGAVCK